MKAKTITTINKSYHIINSETVFKAGFAFTWGIIVAISCAMSLMSIILYIFSKFS